MVLSVAPSFLRVVRRTIARLRGLPVRNLHSALLCIESRVLFSSDDSS
jgi:hypothetical protein